ncbi:hypothetical protein ABB02_00656 [Clostridiaceae bacterium JG1575]|nr:hypothetical protein ABB02_00656 [Clostridiaceae bacterium JG1575]
MDSHEEHHVAQERIHYNNHKRRGKLLRSAQPWILALLFLLSLLTVVLVMKNYTDHRIQEANQIMNSESKEYKDLERRIYERLPFRRIYDAVSPKLAGVAVNRTAFSRGSMLDLSNAVLCDASGHLLVPTRRVEGQSAAFVRVESATGPKVYLGDVVGHDEVTGLSLLQVPELTGQKGVQWLKNDVALAQTVAVMASPTGDRDQGNVSQAIVHSLPRLYALSKEQGGFQVHAFVLNLEPYDGNDGGLVLGMDGSVLGLVSRALSQRLGLGNQGAVVPSTEVLTVISRILRTEGFSPLAFGVKGDLAAYGPRKEKGFYVLEVTPGSAAQRAGIRPTDIILQIDQTRIKETQSLERALAGHRSGDEFQCIILRGRKEITLRVRLY